MARKNNTVVLDKDDKVIHSEILESEPTIYDLLPLVMEEVGAIPKDRQPDSGPKFKFRGIDDALNAVHPALTKHKISLEPYVEEQTIERGQIEKRDGTTGYQSHAIVRLRLRFYAPDGSFIEALTVGEALDNGDKALSKAMAMAMKYALFFGLCIPVDAEAIDDGDAEGQEHETTQQSQSPAGNPDANEMDSQTTLDSFVERLDKCECSDDVNKVFEEIQNGNLREKMRSIHHERLTAKFKEIHAKHPGP